MLFLLNLLIFGVDHEVIVDSFENDLITLKIKPLYTPAKMQRIYIFSQTGHRLAKLDSDMNVLFDVSKTDWIVPEVFGENVFGNIMKGTNPPVLNISCYRSNPDIFLFTDTEKRRMYVIVKIPEKWQFTGCEFQGLSFKKFRFSNLLYLYTDTGLKDGIHKIDLEFLLPHGLKKTLSRDVFVFNGIANFLRGNTVPFFAEYVPPYQHTVKPGETLWSIANMYNLRTADLELVNGLQDGSKIISGQILKLAKVRFDASLTTIVVNTTVARLALYYNGTLVKSFPVAIGKSDTTPPGVYWIVKKEIDPALYWYGEYIPPRSPINGLGTRYLQLSNPTYGIHGTTKPWEIGKRISHGCIRMLNQDIETLDAFIDLGTKVIVIKSMEAFPKKLEDLL